MLVWALEPTGRQRLTTRSLIVVEIIMTKFESTLNRLVCSLLYLVSFLVISDFEGQLRTLTAMLIFALGLFYSATYFPRFLSSNNLKARCIFKVIIAVLAILHFLPFITLVTS